MSFRSRVLDALDIKKSSVKLQVNETFPLIYSETGNAGGELAGSLAATTRETAVSYAVSKTLIDTKIGPNPIGGGAFKQSLDVLGFVVGKDIVEPTWSLTDTDANISLYKNMYPITTPSVLAAVSSLTAGTVADAHSRVPHVGGQDAVYTGFHCLNGIYDSESKGITMFSIRLEATP